MKIQTTVTVNELVEVDIQLPYYCKNGDTLYFIQSEDLTIEVTNNTYYSSVMTNPTSWVEKKVASAVTVTEDEFNEALQLALNKIPSPSKAVAA
jgi:hypothetical protein